MDQKKPEEEMGVVLKVLINEKTLAFKALQNRNKNVMEITNTIQFY